MSLQKIAQFLCPHKTKWIHVDCNETVTDTKDGFETVTYHLYCIICGKKFEVVYARSNEDN